MIEIQSFFVVVVITRTPSHVRLFVTLWPVAPLGFSVHGILQGRILERVAIPFFRGLNQPRGQTWVSCIAGRFVNI